MEKAKAEVSHLVTVGGPSVIPNPKKKLLDQVREVIRVKHYSIRTETTYVDWIKRFILFHGKRHPRETGASEAHWHWAVVAADPLGSAPACPVAEIHFAFISY